MRPPLLVPSETRIGVAQPLTDACKTGRHDECRGMIGFHNCACSCHHGRTVAGTCSMYGCDCHEQGDRHGLPFQRRHRIACVWAILQPKAER